MRIKNHNFQNSLYLLLWCINVIQVCYNKFICFEVFYLIRMTCIITYCSFNTFIHNFYKNPKCHENVKKYC